MFACKQGFLGKESMRICVSCDHDELDFTVGKEVIRCAIVFDLRKINSAVRAFGSGGRVGGSLSSLQDGHNLVVWDGRDEREVEALGRKAVANNADFDRSHG